MAAAWGQTICEGWRALPGTAIWCWHGATGGQGQRGVVAGCITYIHHHRHIMWYVCIVKYICIDIVWISISVECKDFKDDLCETVKLHHLRELCHLPHLTISERLPWISRLFWSLLPDFIIIECSSCSIFRRSCHHGVLDSTASPSYPEHTWYRWIDQAFMCLAIVPRMSSFKRDS